MTERTDSIRLPYDQARCAPVACTMAARCARKLASIPPPPHQSSMSSQDSWGQGGSALCAGYIDAASIRKQALAGPAPRVFPPIWSGA